MTETKQKSGQNQIHTIVFHKRKKKKKVEEVSVFAAYIRFSNNAFLDKEQRHFKE